MWAFVFGVMQPGARAGEHAGEGVEGTRTQAYGHGADLDVHDIALGAEGDDVAAIGREELERVAVAHSCMVSKVKTVFNIEWIARSN